MYDQLIDEKRLLLEARLEPVQGSRFQPTGFPDLGAATYQTADGVRMLLVESAQSMANRLESTIVGPDNELIPELKGLPYIRAYLTEETDTTTNSLIEAHRINSPFIISDDNFKEKFKEASGYKPNNPINWQKIAQTIFHYDVNSLLHGVFLANLEDGRIKIQRAISGFIEAKNIQEVVSGGVKNNPIDPTGKLRAKNYDKDVYGNVPYQRVEYTADEITAYFNIDLGLLHSYELGDDAFELLVSLALYKVKAFIKGGTRLRTACDLKLAKDLKVEEINDFEVPAGAALLEHLQQKISNCKSMFADPPVTEITTATVVKKKQISAESEELGG